MNINPASRGQTDASSARSAVCAYWCGNDHGQSDRLPALNLAEVIAH